MGIKNRTSIAILLGVYNGSSYLEDQVMSIISQSNNDWTLFIRDDKSTDNSLSIIQGLCTKYERLICLDDDKGNLGSMNNFFELLDVVDSEYYMFCDQDDIWLPDKIEVSLSMLKDIEYSDPRSPILIHTDLIVVDENLEVIAQSFWDYSKISISRISTFKYLAVYNLVTGCTMLFNKLAKDVSFPISLNASMHDIWIALKVSNAKGIIAAVDQATILYRQHKSNVLGAKSVNGLAYFINKWRNIRLTISTNNARLMMIREIRPYSLAEYLKHKILYTFRR
jgi:glycosyltransferase involved in cell wall biosynthesis